MNWTLEDVIEFVEACYDRDTILDVLMGYASHWFPRRMVLIVGRAWVQLFSTAAFELPDDIPRELRRAEVDADAPAVSDEAATGTADELGLGQLFEQLEIDEPLIRTIGVTIGARVAIVLVGAIHSDVVETGALEAAASAAGRQLEDVIRMAKADELPPVDERVPPFPQPNARAPGSVSIPTDDARTTQNLSDFDPADMPAEPQPSGPRMAAAVGAEEDESEDEEAENPNATSFGLPFVEGGALPGRQVSESTRSEVSEVSEASGTREGVAYQSEASEADDGTMIGAPMAEDKFPGDLGEVLDKHPRPTVLDEEPSDSDVIELGGSESGVRVVSPREIDSNEAQRTQLGGIASGEDGKGKKIPAAKKLTDSGTQIGTPKKIGNTNRTILGVGGDEDLVHSTLERAESEAAVAAANQVLSADESGEVSPTRSEDGKDSWMNARSAGGVPAAMILKPARKKRKRDPKITPRLANEDSSSTVSGKPAVPDPDADPEPAAPPAAPKPRVDERPTKVATNPLESDLGAEKSRGTEIAGPNRTTLGGAFSRANENETRKFDSDDEVDDAWFDYFADNAEDRSPDAEAALNFSLSEPSEDPHTIPPETLERLLDSGPAMVDMQEQFMILDSRDRDKAFEAAEKVAELGEHAVEVLDLMFPGRIFLDRYQFGDDMPPVDRHGPVLHALVRLGDLALPVASEHLTDSSNEARFYAVYLLTKLDAEPVLPELFDRLFDRDKQTRSIAADLVLQYQSSPAFNDDVRGKIREELLSGDDVHMTVAAELLARLRDVDAVVTLIDAMEDAATPRVKVAILDALTEITLHHWSSPYEWRQWWTKAKNETRQDWIVEALDASQAELRRRAHDEVQRIPGFELNYHPDQPSKLRQRAQKELRAWYARA